MNANQASQTSALQFLQVLTGFFWNPFYRIWRVENNVKNVSLFSLKTQIFCNEFLFKGFRCPSNKIKKGWLFVWNTNKSSFAQSVCKNVIIEDNLIKSIIRATSGYITDAKAYTYILEQGSVMLFVLPLSDQDSMSFL